MKVPPFGLDSNFHQTENQEHTQLTAGGSPAPGEFQVGDVCGGTYEILALIGSGGMGHVYRVRHTMMHQEYALKTLSAEQVNELAWRRFQNEAQAIARMSHPNIVGIYNLGLHQDRLPFYVMDLVNGTTLMDRLRTSGPMSLNETLAIFSEVATGMGYAHRKGIVHRDIKPPNILLLSDSGPGGGRVKIVDFGIAKLSGIKDKANQGLTSVGEICGSPFYMSPEQCNGGRVDTRSDIYSFGCTLFETLTGGPPFKGRNAVETMLMHQQATPPSLFQATGKKYPQMLEQALATMLAKAPMDRYQNMERIIQDFNIIMAGKEEAIRPFVSQMSETQRLTQKQLALKEKEEAEGEEETRPGLGKKLAVGALSLVLATGLVVGALALYKVLTPTTVMPRGATHFTKINSTGKIGSPNPESTDNKAAVSNSAVATPTQKTDPASTVSAEPAAKKQITYSHEELKDGKRVLCFDFPPGVCLGSLRTNGKKENRLAQGHLEYPVGVQLELVPDESAANNVDCLSHFRKGDIHKVMFGSITGTNAMVDAISKIQGVKELQLTACDSIDDGALKALAKMTDLVELRLEVTSITGKGLARLPYLKQLERIYFCSGPDGDDLCIALSGSEKLHELYVDNSPLTYSGLKAVSTLTNLDSLMLNTTKLNDAELKELAKIPHLRRLFALNCGITAKQVPILRTFPALRVLGINSFSLKQRDYFEILRGLPRVQVQ